MDRITRIISALLLLLSALPCLAQDEGPFQDGRWGGAVDFGAAPGSGPSSPGTVGEGPEVLVLRLFPADPETGASAGGLVDLPSRGILGFPLGFLERKPWGLSFSLRGAGEGGASQSGPQSGALFDGLIELRLPPPTEDADESRTLAGTALLLSAEGEGGRRLIAQGSFTLVFTKGASRGLEFGSDYKVATGRGVLPGSLLVPELGLRASVPLVLLLSGADADRDGNNYSVPGRSDSLAALAMALRELGIASLRFDKRGTGEAYALVRREEELRFDDHVDDARAALRQLAADPRFSSVTVAGLGEGALVGACALDLAEADDPIAAAAGRVGGMAALCASGRTEVEAAEKALSTVPEERKAEGAAIMAALKSGSSYPNPSPYFADYFRPSVQGYLSSLFARDIRAAFASLNRPILVVAGGSDLQVASAEAELLAAANGRAAYRVLPGMSHALKWVGDDERANYESFTNPKLPLAAGLADLIAAFAKLSAGQGRDLPGEDPRPTIEAVIKPASMSLPESSPASESLPDPAPLPESTTSSEAQLGPASESSADPSTEALPEPAIKPPAEATPSTEAAPLPEATPSTEAPPPESRALETIGAQAEAQGGDDAAE
jgi:uncharacterized protein